MKQTHRKINSRHIEARPEGVVFLLEDRDRPGIVGHVGTLMGKHGLNIAGLSLRRIPRRSRDLHGSG